MAKVSRKLRDAMGVAREVMKSGALRREDYIWSFAPYFRPAFDAVKAMPDHRLSDEEIAHLVGSVLWWMGDGHHAYSFDELQPYCDAGYLFRAVFETGVASTSPRHED